MLKCGARNIRSSNASENNLIDEISKADFLLAYAVMHGDDAEAERLCTKFRHLASHGDKQKDA